MEREDIHIISRHSNWSESAIYKALRQKIYPDAKSWNKFLQFLFFSLGVGFAVSGILFFFAYNWAGMHKFFKLGMIESLIVALSLVLLLSKVSEVIKNILLTGISVLVGVLLAVFGQIYQTGANAYDFFLGWTAFITLSAIISNYPPLWLVYLILGNTTFVLYTQQVVTGWSEIFVANLLFASNSIILTTFLLLPKLKLVEKVPFWFTNIMALAVISLSTSVISVSFFDEYEPPYFIFTGMSIIVYGLGIWYGIKAKRTFYLSIIPFSLIVIFSALLIKVSDGATMFFIVSLFIIISVTALIKGLLVIQKKWNNE